MIEAKVIADSQFNGARLTTMIVTMPRIILAEFNTHRVFSRNSASSRAIPFAKMVASVKENPFIPIAWQKDHPGMQGTEYFTSQDEIVSLNNGWLVARDRAIESADLYSRVGVTKQLCNRLLEPFMWHTVIVSSTEWMNFFELRCPKYLGDDGQFYKSKVECEFYSKLYVGEGSDKLVFNWQERNKGQAEIHMMALAEAMYNAYDVSAPKVLQEGEWHIPFGDDISTDDLHDYGITELDNDYDEDELMRCVAVARCARISYTVVGEENKPINYANDIKLHDRLAKAGHWSPFEHIACANYNQSGNFKGFGQYRKIFLGENLEEDNG